MIAVYKSIWTPAFRRRHLVAGLLCILFSGVAHGQAPISVSVNPVEAPGAAPLESIYGETFLTHLLNTTAEYRWTRTVLQLQGGPDCLTAVADKNITYIPSFSTYTFELGPEEENFPLGVNLINLDTTLCCALVHLAVHPEGDTTNTVTIAYVFGDCLTQTEEPDNAATLIFPNPARDRFVFSRPVKASGLQLFSPDGQLVRSWKTCTGSFDIPDLPAGHYFLVLLDHDGIPFHALKLVKQ
ncbi:MAG: T9SS type A sorting domain-containing protein [Bacteroidetes bacterium]|nr:MAG: T9SS type A sorting domain-containing protein [Bacteroidota bacterium]